MINFFLDYEPRYTNSNNSKMICPLSVDAIFNRFDNQQLLLSYKVEEEYATVQLPPLNDVCQNICLPIKREMNGKPILLTPECYKSVCPNLNAKDIKQRLQHIPVDKTTSNQTSPDASFLLEEQSYKISLYELITTQVLPKWKQYINSKTERREADFSKKPRTDTFKKKVLRDMREFYRILFRKRFHLSQYKTIKGVTKCLNTFFGELGLSLTQSDLNDYHLFRYVHQTHLYTSMKLQKIEEESKDSPFKVIEKYNDARFRRLLKHPLSATMFYFVFNNFLEFYFPLIKPEYRDSVMSIISPTLNLYRRATNPGDLMKVDFLF